MIIPFLKSGRTYLFFALLLSLGFALAETHEVCPSCQLKSLRTAIIQAQVGDRILVRGGIYKEGNIIIDKSLELVGEDWPILDGDAKYEILTIQADDVTIKGFVLQNAGVSHTEDLAAIKTMNVSNCVIEDNKLIDNFFGIYLGKSHHCQILRNDVLAHGTTEAFSGNAIHLWDCYNVTISDNHLQGHRDGIYFEFVRDSTIEHNVSEENLRYGLHFMYSDDNIFHENTFHKNGAGVAVMYSKHIDMTRNTFSDNWGGAIYGLLLKEINDSYLQENIFTDNSVAIFLDGANRTDISFNEFSHNGYALRILTSSMAVSITHNNFIANSFDVSTNGGRSYNAFFENYWDAYQGYDLDHDGIGDIAYRPVRLFAMTIENYPQTMILMRSPLEQFLDYAERVLPIFTPKAIEDDRPLMRSLQW